MVERITDYVEEELTFDVYEMDDFQTYPRDRGRYTVLGMTSIQRFIMSLLLLIAVFAFGSIVLAYSEKVALFF